MVLVFKFQLALQFLVATFNDQPLFWNSFMSKLSLCLLTMGCHGNKTLCLYSIYPYTIVATCNDQRNGQKCAFNKKLLSKFRRWKVFTGRIKIMIRSATIQVYGIYEPKPVNCICYIEAQA